MAETKPKIEIYQISGSIMFKLEHDGIIKHVPNDPRNGDYQFIKVHFDGLKPKSKEKLDLIKKMKEYNFEFQEI